MTASPRPAAVPSPSAGAGLPAPPGPWSEFFRAATQPSRAALAGTLAVFALVWTAALALVRPELFAAVHVGWFMDDTHDNPMVVTARVLQIRDGEPQPRGVALVGPSSLLESFSGAQAMSTALGELTGTPVPVSNLCSGGLRVWEYAAVVEGTGDRIGGALVLSVSPNVLNKSHRFLREVAERPRLGLRSPAFDEELRRAEVEPFARTGIYLVDSWPFVFPRLELALVHLFTGPVETVQRQNRWRKRWSEERMLENLAREPRQLAPIAPSNLEVIARVIERRRRLGPVEFVLLEAAWNPRARAAFDPAALVEYHELLERFAREHGVHYWDLNNEADFEDADFDDPYHLRAGPARERYTRLLCGRLAGLLGEDR